MTVVSGATERPEGLVAGVFFDSLVGLGVEPQIARCAADALVSTTSEEELLSMGIASTPTPAGVTTLLETAALSCGVLQSQLDQGFRQG